MAGETPAPVRRTRRRRAGTAEAARASTLGLTDAAEQAREQPATAGEGPSPVRRTRRRRASSADGARATTLGPTDAAEIASIAGIASAATPEEVERRPRRRRRRPAAAETGAEPPAASVETEGAPSHRPRRPRRIAAPSPSPAEPAQAVEPAGPEPARRRRRGRARPTVAEAEAPVVLEGAQTLGSLVAAVHSIQAKVDDLSARLHGDARPTSLSKVAVFVDVPNIMYAAERSRAKIDYGDLLQYLVGNRELVRAAAYAPISDDPTEALETQRFVQPFIAKGFRVVTKPLKRFADGTVKANFDVELAMDVLTMSDRLDVVTLVSGDGDFRRLVELVASKGVRVEVVGFGHSTAAELRATADRFIDVADYMRELKAEKK